MIGATDVKIFRLIRQLSLNFKNHKLTTLVLCTKITAHAGGRKVCDIPAHHISYAEPRALLLQRA